MKNDFKELKIMVKEISRKSYISFNELCPKHVPIVVLL